VRGVASRRTGNSSRIVWGMSMVTVCVYLWDYTLEIWGVKMTFLLYQRAEQTKIAQKNAHEQVKLLTLGIKICKFVVFYLKLYAQLAVSSSSLKCLTAKASLEDLNEQTLNGQAPLWSETK
jgi:hypothetical protein